MDKGISYREYINSEVWRNKSLALRETHPFCYCCGSSKELAVHHMNYTNLGNEKEGDLKVLCSKCHRKVHFSNSGKFYNNYPRTYKRVQGLRRYHINYEGYKPNEQTMRRS